MENQLNLLNHLNNRTTLNELQDYIKKVIELRNFDKQPIEQTMLLLTEEIGELAKAIRKDATNMSVDNSKLSHYESIESEIADVFIVLTSICNKLNINLYNSIIEKEKKNCNRTWN